MNEEKWIAPGSQCDCCNRKRRGDEPRWWEEHCYKFTFDFCPECDKNRRGDCDVIMMKCMKDWRKYCEECWTKEKAEKEAKCIL